MSEPLYRTDAYLAEFDAVVTAVDSAVVVLDRTAFYPGGGGQPHDLGTLAAGERTWRVIRVRKSDAGILHELDAEPPPVGTPMRGALDWDRRYTPLSFPAWRAGAIGRFASDAVRTLSRAPQHTGRWRIEASIFRPVTARPSLALPRRFPCSAIALPRRIVSTGHPVTSQPSHGL